MTDEEILERTAEIQEQRDNEYSASLLIIFGAFLVY